MKTSSSQLELLQQKMAALETEVAQLRQSHCPDRPASGNNFASVTDRRGMMKKIAGLAVGVAAAGLLKPSRALADDGNPLTFGSITTGATANSQTSAARFVYNGAAVDGALFLFEDGTEYTPVSSGQDAVLAGLATSSGPGGATVGVYGLSEADSGSGVIGAATGFYSFGVTGVADEPGSSGTGGVFYGDKVGVSATGTSDIGVGGDFNGERAALALSLGFGAVADPNAGVTKSQVGDVYPGSTNGSLWYKAGGSVPYCRLADSTTAGALTAFASSSRFVNTITGSGNTYAGQHLIGGATAAYQIGGVTVSGNTVPANARAIIGRIADPNPAGPGGSILVGAANPPVGGVIAIVAGAPQNSSFISALDASGNLYVKNTSASNSTDIIIDIQGYYL
jgi:hypothetical protein